MPNGLTGVRAPAAGAPAARAAGHGGTDAPVLRVRPHSGRKKGFREEQLLFSRASVNCIEWSEPKSLDSVWLRTITEKSVDSRPENRTDSEGAAGQPSRRARGQRVKRPSLREGGGTFGTSHQRVAAVLRSPEDRGGRGSRPARVRCTRSWTVRESGRGVASMRPRE
jgi:hypothetical protein